MDTTAETEAKISKDLAAHEEAIGGHDFNSAMVVRYEDLETIIAENRRLRARETELLTKNSALVLENRNLRDGIADLAPASDATGTFSSILRGQVRAFHYAFDMPTRETLTDSPPTEMEVRLRCKLIIEEAFEFAEACLTIFPAVIPDDSQPRKAPITLPRTSLSNLKANAIRMITDPEWYYVDVDLPEAADALADLAYVTEGGWLTFGIDPQPVLDEVHRANISKVGGGKDAEGKKLKPPGWTPPDIARVLREQGWKP